MEKKKSPFKEILRQTMIKKGMTQTELSKASGIRDSSISQYLSGKNEPREVTRLALSKALGISDDELFPQKFRKINLEMNMYCPRKKTIKGCLNCKLEHCVYDRGGETLALPPEERKRYLESQKLRYRRRKERLKSEK